MIKVTQNRIDEWLVKGFQGVYYMIRDRLIEGSIDQKRLIELKELNEALTLLLEGKEKK